jgi:hypothetical protein
MSTINVVTVLVVTGAVAFGLSLVIHRLFPGLAQLDPGPWSATLGYLAAAYGVIVGFAIVFFFGQFSSARQAIGDEATSIGTAFDEAVLFPESEREIRHSLICYARAVPEREWPTLASTGESAPAVDEAYQDVILALGDVTEPADATFQPAAATNMFVQVGNISTARETRLVAAELEVHTLLKALLYGGGALVIGLLFIVSLRAHRLAQAALVGLSAVFTAVMILIVLVLSTPFKEGVGRLEPRLIEETTASMESGAPEAAALPCSFDQAE